jgi:hypothetical protein
MKALVGTDLCMHTHVGFRTRGQVHIEYADGRTVEFVAPQAIVIEAPGAAQSESRVGMPFLPKRKTAGFS